MRKTLLAIAVLAFMASAAIAQQKKINWGIKAHFTVTKFNETSSNPSIGTTNFGSKGGENVKNIDIGVFAEMNIAKNVVFQPGLSYIHKGGASIYVQGDYSSDNTTDVGSEILLNYLELPLNLLYKIPLKFGKIFVGMGPYAAIALSAQNQQTTASLDSLNNTTQIHSTQNIKIGNGKDEQKLVNFGVNALLGFRFNNGLEIGGGMGFELSNLSNVPYVKTHNQTISASVGYFF